MLIFKLISILLIETVTAIIFFYDPVSFIQLMGTRFRTEYYRLFFADQRTGQFGNQFTKELGDGSSVVLLSYLQDIYCVLYQSMLKPASGA